MLLLRKLFVSFIAATAFTSAAPVASISDVSTSARIFNPRCECSTNPLPVVVNDCKSKISPLVDQLQSLGGKDCTAKNIEPIVAEIKDVLFDGIAQINVLVSSSVDINVKLSDASGVVLSVSDCGKLIASLVMLVFDCISAVLKVVVSGEATAVIAIFADLGICIGRFLQASCSVATGNGGLLAAVLPIIQGSLGVCITLGITSSFDFLGFDFSSLSATAVATVTAVAGGVISASPTTGGAFTVATETATTTVTSIVLILKDCSSKVLPLVEQLKSLSSQNCTSDKISPITEQIKSVLSSCVTQIQGLAGRGKEVVLSSEGTLISITDCAYLCGDIAIAMYIDRPSQGFRHR
ncbi:hypothetical protein PM082_010547 [Marasmius tenuissimus]|nr:hypothetical protein PM082_010547 [Marasmius tenuissimus]